MQKGQTALEYLMTYGWAILIVIIVVGALYMLGLTKPCRWTGTQIREFADFVVANPKMTTAGLSFDFSRSKPDTVYFESVSLSGDATYSLGAPTVGTVINSTASRYSLTITTTKLAGDCYNVDVSIKYNVIAAGVNVTYTVAGKISGIIESV